MVYFMFGGQFKVEFVFFILVVEVIDIIGCGDFFVGGLVYGLFCDWMDYVRVVQFVNVLGVMWMQGIIFEVFKLLFDMEVIFWQYYEVNVCL